MDGGNYYHTVIEISNNEFLCNHIHRYSVIAHEYFIPTK